MSLGAIKESLFRTGSDDVPQMSRTLGVLYLSGGLLILLSLLLSHPEDAFEPGLYGIVAIGVFGGAGQIVWARQARAWMVHGILAAGTFLICLAEYFADMPLGQTCSTGIACWDGHETAEALIGRADRKMYAAKVQSQDRAKR